MDELDEDDQPLVAVGAVFYWSMGYHHDARGTRHLSNDLRFRRLPVWRKADLQKLSEPSEFDKFFS